MKCWNLLFSIFSDEFCWLRICGLMKPGTRADDVNQTVTILCEQASQSWFNEWRTFPPIVGRVAPGKMLAQFFSGDFHLASYLGVDPCSQVSSSGKTFLYVTRDHIAQSNISQGQISQELLPSGNNCLRHFERLPESCFWLFQWSSFPYFLVTELHRAYFIKRSRGLRKTHWIQRANFEKLTPKIRIDGCRWMIRDLIQVFRAKSSSSLSNWWSERWWKP
jgi:hypothetical protein